MSQDWRDDKGPRDQESEPGDDVATLYSWANLHGAKYRDFSASRQEMRARMRQRAMAEQARVAREEAERMASPEAEQELLEDLLPQLRHGAARGRAPSPGSSAPVKFIDKFGGQGKSRPAPVHEMRPLGSRTAGRMREESEPEEEFDEPQPEQPAWLAQRSVAPSGPGKETLQQSRERVASRWFALQGIFGAAMGEGEPAGGSDGQAQALALFSLAGGVGKTSLVAALGRGLAARGERVLLVDTSPFGLLPYYFGARDVKPGVVRTFSGGTNDPPIRVLTLPPDSGRGDADGLRREVTRAAQDAGRILIDVASGSAEMLRQALRLSPTVLVPLVPDMASVVTLHAVEGLVRSQDAEGHASEPWFVLNQFDSSLPLHLDVREVLRQQLDERLLPFALQRNMAVSEALAEGMTVMDYAPSSPAADEVMHLVNWVRKSSSVAVRGPRGARWSER